MKYVRVNGDEKGMDIMNELDIKFNMVDQFPNDKDFKENGKRLYSCTAYYLVMPDFVFLKSYDTLIAAYDRNTNTLYDFLRYAYGYTATSNQHIHKFMRKITEEGW